RNHFEIAAADLRTLAAHPNHPLRPVEQRVVLAALVSDVDPLVAEGAIVDHLLNRTVAAGEAAVALAGPLHRRPRALALGLREIVAHPDLVAVEHHRRAGQREQQAERQLETASIVAEHRRDPPPDAAVVLLPPLV